MAEDTLESETREILKQVDLGVVGRTGLTRFSGRVQEEFLSSLQGRSGRKTFRQMADNDPVVGASLSAYTMVARQADWFVEPATQDSADLERAAFLEGAMDDMSVSWGDTLAEILSMLVYGWSYFEILFKHRRGPDESDPTKRSKFTDGKVGWRRFEIRSQDSLDRWQFDEEGGIEAMVQNVNGEEFVVPIQKALLFRTTSHKNNPEGKSILRNAYRAWYFKRNIEELEGIGVERDLAGLPVFRVPAEYLTDKASPAQKNTVDELESIGQSLKNDEQSYVVLPSHRDENGNEMFEFELKSPSGKKLFNTSEIITRWDQRLAGSMLSDFILLGQDNVGSFALASSKTSVFSMAVDAYLTHIEEVMNKHAVPQLFRLNGEDTESLPKLRHSDVEDVGLAELGLYIQRLAQVGALNLDQPLESRLREVGGLPDRDETTERPPNEGQMQPGQPAIGGGDDDEDDDNDDEDAS